MAAKKGEETRAVILDRAVEVARRDGLGGLSIGGLAKTVGMSKSGLFAHFQSKDGLQIQVIVAASELFVSRVVRPALREPRGVPRLQAMLGNWLHWAGRGRGGCIFVAASGELDDRDGPVRDALLSAQEDWIATLTRAATIAVEEGHFRRDLDVQQFAFELYSAMLGFHLYRRLLRRDDAEDRCRSAFRALIHRAADPALVSTLPPT